MSQFTPGHAVVGGALIALSLAILLISSGRVAGLSGIVGGLVRPAAGEWSWRMWFVIGMLGAGAMFRIAAPGTFDAGARAPLVVVAVTGALVGVGTRLANGCTSGHGVCGISRGSRRSIVATAVFFAVAVVTATLTERMW